MQDLFVDLFRGRLQDVATEPQLQPLAGESFEYKTAKQRGGSEE